MATVFTKLVATTVVTPPATQGGATTSVVTWAEQEGDLIDLINPFVPLATPAGSLARLGAVLLLSKIFLQS